MCLGQEADDEERKNVATLLIRSVPNYNPASLKRQLKKQLGTRRHMPSQLQSIQIPSTLVSVGTRVFHPIRGIGTVVSIADGAQEPWTVHFEGTDVAQYAIL